ncbi:MAG: homoserine kinase [Candidatus Nitrosocaldaceae archaeon]|nr:MAG: homoserine kinase [Candidatus Nitrosocaldaceae archaeon]
MKAIAPSSTANLGPGFDVFGLALDAYYDQVSIEQIREGIVLESEDNIPLDIDKNSAGLAALNLCKDYDIKDGLRIKIKKGVPAGYGLGSSGASAAAVVKALDAMYELNLSNEELIKYAAIGEQASAGSIHYDNVAASLLGGFVIVRSNPLRVVKIEPPELTLCIVTPKIETPNMKTSISRSVLPKEVPLKSMVENLANASMIIAGFMLKDINLITESIRDVIVEPARANIIKGYHQVKKKALEAGALAFTISGAGPSLLAFVDDNGYKVRDAMLEGFNEVGIDAVAKITKPDKEGARII